MGNSRYTVQEYGYHFVNCSYLPVLFHYKLFCLDAASQFAQVSLKLCCVTTTFQM